MEKAFPSHFPGYCLSFHFSIHSNLICPACDHLSLLTFHSPLGFLRLYIGRWVGSHKLGLINMQKPNGVDSNKLEQATNICTCKCPFSVSFWQSTRLPRSIDCLSRKWRPTNEDRCLGTTEHRITDPKTLQNTLDPLQGNAFIFSACTAQKVGS